MSEFTQREKTTLENRYSKEDEIKNCFICEDILNPNPIFKLSPNAKILILGQAPGKKVDESGVLFSDASGDRLREWLGVTSEQFYDENNFAILPMAFCYPGQAKSGDKPPPKICATTWMELMLQNINDVKLTIIVGKYALDYHLNNPKQSLTELVKQNDDFLPSKIILPHPSPRNNIWLSKNKWFENDIVYKIQKRVSEIII